MSNSSLLSQLLSVLVAFAISAQGHCGAQAVGFELQELKTTLESSARQIGELQAQLAAERAKNQVLTQSLSASNSEAASSKEGLERLRSLLEGLGIGALEGNTKEVQERLLAALSDMRMLDDQNGRLIESLVKLAEASAAYAKSGVATDPKLSDGLKNAVDAAMKVVRAAGSTGSSSADSLDLHNASVVSVKPESRLVVLNVGSRDGVRVGMPFSVIRDDQTVGKLLIVDVRKTIAGAVIQDTTNTKQTIQIGDRGVVDTDHRF